MRAKIRNSLQTVLDRAVRQTQSTFALQGRAGFTGVSRETATPPRSITTAGVDADGNTITLYPAMTELDSTESGAMTS